jgi:hypothetical protein
MYMLLLISDTAKRATRSWLIDTDQDMKGRRVIADLHGGDLDSSNAKAEFQEIKDKVMEEVRKVSLGVQLLCLTNCNY